MCKTIKQKVRFQASPATVYDLLAVSEKHSDVTGHKAEAWRTDDFPAGVFSMAAVVLTPTKNGGTDLVLPHRRVPKDLIPEVEKAWRESSISPLRKWIVRCLYKRTMQPSKRLRSAYL